MGKGPANTLILIETKTIQKLRTRILIAFRFNTVVTYLDRINIGFAASAMNKELVIARQPAARLGSILESTTST